MHGLVQVEEYALLAPLPMAMPSVVAHLVALKHTVTGTCTTGIAKRHMSMLFRGARVLETGNIRS